MKRIFILSFIMPYAENIGLRDCSGFLQIGSQIVLTYVSVQFKLGAILQ